MDMKHGNPQGKDEIQVEILTREAVASHQREAARQAAKQAIRAAHLQTLAGEARRRGKEIQNKVCCWTYRWNFVSDNSLNALHPGRPRLGYDMWKRGLLVRHQVPPGIRLLDGANVYSLSEDGFLIAEQVLDPFILRHQTPSDRPAWTTIQHTLDLQRIAVAAGYDDEGDPGWRTEPETRATFQGALVPDLFAMMEDGCHWVEWERSPKKDIQLEFWVQMLAQWQATAMSNRENRPPRISRLDVIVPNQYQKQRYERMFNRRVADPIYRDKNTRKLNVRKDAPRIEIQRFLGEVVEVFSLDEFLMP